MGQAPPDRSILSQRSLFSLIYRLAVRVGQAVELKQGKGYQRLALLGAVIGDLRLARVLRKTDRALLAPRLLADCLDTAIWSQIPSDNVELAVLPGVPLAFESGYRYGVGGIVVPAATAALTSAVRRLRHRTVTLAPFRWQLVATLVGTATAMLETRHRDAVLHQAEYEEQARTYRALLAGQNDVAMGADSLVDDLCRITPLLGDDISENSIGPILRAWKGALAVKTQTASAYLGNVLSQWQRLHNNFQSDLSADVWFNIAPGDGTIILTAQQAEWLARACDQLDLRGRVTVSTESADQGHRPGTELALEMGPSRIRIPPNETLAVHPFDVGSLGLIACAYWAFDSTTSKNARCARWAIWPVSAISMYWAIWAQRELGRRGDAAHGPIIARACAISVAQALLSSFTIQEPLGPQGKQRLPFLTGVNVIAMMLPLYWRDLTRDQRHGVVGALVATLGLGALLYPEEISGPDLGRELLWVAAASWTTSQLRESLDEGAIRLSASLAEESKCSEDRAFDEGRRSVIRLVSDALASVKKQLGRSQHLDPKLRFEIERRLLALDERMKGLSA